MKKALFILSLILVAFIIISSKGYALEERGVYLKLYLGQVKFVSVANPTRIIIGNPAIADVTNVTNNEITLTPKAIGTTTFAFWDSFGEQSYRIIVASEDMNEIKLRVDNMLEKLNLPGVNTKAEDQENKIFLLGNVKNANDRELINLALGPLKDKVVDLIELKEEEAVVEIGVEVLELDSGITSTLGITWPSSLNIIEKGSPGLASAGTKWSDLFKVSTLQRGTSDGSSSPWTFKLDALIQEGKARVLSRPRLACQSGKEAELMVGGEKPIFTTSVSGTTGATGTTVEYKEFGIKLKITPVVTKGNRIKLGLNVEVSEVGTAEFIGSTTNRTAQAYPLTKRNASTELYLDDDQTMAIGGIIKQKTSEEVRKLPWLAEIPVLGLLFKQKAKTTGDGHSTKGDTELFITLTPKIVTAKKETVAKNNETLKTKAVEMIDEEKFSEMASGSGYAELVKKSILGNFTYPESAREAGFEGTVKLRLHLSSQGELLEALIKNSSGYKILDDNAIEVAKKLGTYPSFPSSIDMNDIWVDVPIIYKID